ncbi:MAG: FkbM family methyltransferase [Actinomycetota bacterium]
MTTTKITTPELLADPPDGMINAYGSLLKLDPSDALFLGSHDYEVYESKLMIGLVRPGDVAVDVGAMIGYYTMILGHGVGPKGRVYAFEPDPDNFAILVENASINGYEHVQPRRAVVGAASGTTQLHRAPEAYRGDGRAYGVPGNRPSVEVEMVALDELIAEEVNICKIDVQGYEGHVLAGMRELIARSPQLVLFLEFTPTSLELAGTDPAELLAEFKRFGFVMYEIEEDAHRIRGTEAASLLERARDANGAFTDDYSNLLLIKGHR